MQWSVEVQQEELHMHVVCAQDALYCMPHTYGQTSSACIWYTCKMHRLRNADAHLTLVISSSCINLGACGACICFWAAALLSVVHV
jgi:hypothetical protein